NYISMTRQDLAANLRFLESCGVGLVEMLCVGGNSRPGMLARLVDREFGSGKHWIGEGADGDGHNIGHVVDAIGDGCAAFRTEVKRHAVAAVGDPHIDRRFSCDADLVARKAGLSAERAAGSHLTGETMAHRDAHWLTLADRTQLAAAARGDARGHRITRPATRSLPGRARRASLPRFRFAGR